MHESLNESIEVALRVLERRYRDANPQSERRFELAKSYMPGGNTRTTLYYEPFPLTITGGNGARVFDADGHKYRDFINEYTAGVYGHNAPEIRAAVLSALDGGINLGGNNLVEVELARLLCERFTSVESVRFTNSGSEANLMAITAAMCFTGRRRIVVFEGGYHGGFISFGLAPAVTNAPFDFNILPFNDLDAIKTLFAECGTGIAAVLVEPMQGAGGCIAASKAFLEALRLTTREAGAVLIFDEVMTSRLAAGGLQSRYRVIPDMTTLGKYIGGGMSFGAFGGRDAIMRQFDPRWGSLTHSGTFNNNLLTMAAGVVGLTQLFPPSTADDLSATGEAMMSRLNALCDRYKVGMQFIGVGSVMNVHFTSRKIESVRDLEGTSKSLRQLLFLHLILAGFYVSPRGYTVLSLPLTAHDVDLFVTSVEEFLRLYGRLLPTRTNGTRISAQEFGTGTSPL